MKAVWNLCHNLWGEIPEKYKTNSNEMNNYELEQIRKRLLGDWLANISAHRIDKERKSASYAKVSSRLILNAFCFLISEFLIVNLFEEQRQLLEFDI